MKKIFVSLLIIAASLNAMATNFAVATLTLKGNTSLEQGEVTLAKTDNPSAASFCAPLYIDQYQVVMYAINGNDKYQVWANADLTDFPLGIKTYSDESYTISVSNVSGSETLSLYDAVDNQTIELVAGQTYNFSAAANSTINDRFIINYQAPAPQYETSLTTNAYGWATFSYNKVLDIPAGLTIYTGEYDEATASLYLHEQEYVAANEGYVAKGAANETYYFNLSDNQAAQYSGYNDLKPASVYATLKADNDIFVLSGNMLYLLDAEGDFPVNKAFLPVAKSAGAPARISMRFGEATGVENVQAAEKAEKFVQDGQILIRRGEAVYNLQGQMVK